MADIKAIITEAATRYGIDPDAALKMAQIESGMNPSAQNKGSSAGGLFQFIDSTWAKYGNGHSKFDPAANADAAMRLLRDNSKYLKGKLGRDLTAGELYLAHQQGMGGAELILRNPNANAVAVLGRKQVLQNGGTDTMTAGQFAGLWTKKMGDTVIPTENLVEGMSPPASMEQSNNSEFSVSTPGRIAYTDVVPARAETKREEIVRQEAADAAAPGLLEGAKLAIENNWSVFAPFRALSGQDPDPNFRLTKEKLETLGKNIPDDYLDEFADAVSDSHAEAIRDRLLHQMEVNQKLGSMGAEGVILSMGAALTDPGAWAATAAIGAATGGLGLGPAIAARFGRAGMVALGAAEGIAGNMATDVPLIAVDPTRRMDELKYSIGTGIVMGGAFGALRANPHMADEVSTLTRLGKEMQEESMAPYLPKVDANSSGGAAEVIAPNALRADAEDLERGYRSLDKQTQVVFGRARFDVVGQMLKSKNPMVRGMARFLGEDAVRAKSGEITQIAATERQANLFKVATNNWLKGFDKAWKRHLKDNQIGFFQSADAMNKFKADVTDYIREFNPSAKQNYPDTVREAATAFQTEMKSFWEMAKKEGLTRTEMGVEHYFPRYADLRAASQKISQYAYGKEARKGGLASLYREAILAKQPDIDPDLAHKLGYAVVDRMARLKAGENLLRPNSSSLDLDDLEEVLQDYLSKNEIENVKAYMMRDQGKETVGGSSRLMHRIDFDENFSALVKNQHTGAMEEVKIKDFYINDPNVAFHMYSRQMSGQIAMAKVKIRDAKGNLLLDGIRDANDFEKLKKQVMAVGDMHGAHTEKDLENLDFMYSAITGAPYKGWSQGGDFSTFLTMLRDFNFTRLMGQVGFSQLPEIGRVTSQVGIKTMYQAMPSFRQLIKLTRSGRMDDALAEELDALGAFGTDLLRGAYHVTADDFGVPIALGGDTAMQRAFNKVNPVQAKMNHFVAKYSGMGPVNALFQRWASRAMAVKFVNMAKFGDKVNVNRLKALGLSEEMQAKIFESIKTHAAFKGNGSRATQLDKLNVHLWDGNVSSAFQEAIYRASRNMILENDAGQFAKWMSHPLGKTVLQFRSFAVASWSKALLQGMNLRDAEAAIGFLSTSFLGAMVYAGQTHLNLIGDPQRDKKLAERLSWGNLGLAGIQRSSESSLLPIPVDMLSQLLTGEPLFDMRSSGLQTSVDNAFGNPTMDLISTGFKAAMGATTAVTTGDDYSAPDFRNLTRTLPFQRMMGFTQFFNWISSGLPQREQRD